MRVSESLFYNGQIITDGCNVPMIIRILQNRSLCFQIISDYFANSGWSITITNVSRSSSLRIFSDCLNILITVVNCVAGALNFDAFFAYIFRLFDDFNHCGQFCHRLELMQIPNKILWDWPMIHSYDVKSSPTCERLMLLVRLSSKNPRQFFCWRQLDMLYWLPQYTFLF